MAQDASFHGTKDGVCGYLSDVVTSVNRLKPHRNPPKSDPGGGPGGGPGGPRGGPEGPGGGPGHPGAPSCFYIRN